MSSATQISQPRPEEMASTASHVGSDAPEPIAWRSWPIVDSWRSLVPLAILAIALLVLIGLTTDSLWNVPLSALVIVAAAGRLWLPVQYEVNSRGLVRTCMGRTRRVSWTAVPAVDVLPHGFRLLSNAEPGVFDPWTALFVPWGPQRERITAVLREQVCVLETALDTSK
jgi:hypothetical protein